MYTLQRANVVKLTDSEVKRDKYLAGGYQLVEQPEEKPAALPDEDIPAETEQKDGAEAAAKGKVKSGDKKGS